MRNRIDGRCLEILGSDWLRNGAKTNGILDNRNCKLTRTNINNAIRKLGTRYTHNKLVAELGFGFWRYLFASKQYRATGQILMEIFPAKPTSTASSQYNQKYVFNRLAQINKFRNRIAHHEPICFKPSQAVNDSYYAREHYDIIIQLFRWMGINEIELLYGMDHIGSICMRLDRL